MTRPQEVVLRTLEDLGAEDFEKFKWHLQQKGALEDFPAIAKSNLENVNRMKTVDQMFSTYSMNTIKVTRIVLVKINQNELLKNLSNTISEPLEKGRKEASELYQKVPKNIIKSSKNVRKSGKTLSKASKTLKQPKGTNMATPQEVVLRTLEDLGAEDFQTFQWYLQMNGGLEDFPAIPKSKLENVNRVKTVDQMFSTYSMNTIKVTRIVLVKMNQNELVKNLSNTISEPAGKS
uniref:Pyrin domain-containing protein n=1 Tax=Sander lucioperca TaxID=283035 RepID=A0A8C9XVR9_SANLU